MKKKAVYGHIPLNVPDLIWKRNQTNIPVNQKKKKKKIYK